MELKLYSKKLYLSFIALILVAGFTSCSKKDEPTPDGYIMIVNASETSSPQDFFIGTSKKNTTPIGFGQNTSYYSVNTNSDQAAQFADSGSTTVNAAFTIAPGGGQYYSIYYLGTQVAAYGDDLTPPAAGKARVRFINLSSLVTGDVDFGTTGGAVLESKIPNLVASNFYDVAANSTISFYATGTTTSLLNIPFNFVAGKIYTVYVTGSSSSVLNYHICPHN